MKGMMATSDESLKTNEREDKAENTASSAVENDDRKFTLSTSLIQSVPRAEQAEELQDLGLNVYDQTVFEEGIIEQVENAIEKEEKKRQIKAVVDDIKATKIRLKQIEKALDYAPKNKESFSKEAKRKIDSICKEKENKLKQLKSLRAKQRSLLGHVNNGMFPLDVDTDVDSDVEELDPETKFELENVLGTDKTKETERERMIRTGQMTPFGTILGQKKSIKLTSELTDFEKYLMDQAQLHAKKKKTSPIKGKVTMATKGGKELKNKDEFMAVPSTSKDCPALEPMIRKRRRPKEDLGTYIAGEEFKDGKKPFKRISFRWPDPEANLIDLDAVNEAKDSSGSEYFPSGRESESDDEEERVRTVFENKSTKITKKKASGKQKQEDDKTRTKKMVDDGNQENYLKRIRAWKKELLIEKHQKLLQDDEDEAGVLDPDDGYMEFEGGYRIPLRIWNKIYRYQQTCVRWLWELHCQRVGGIVGDEMGLGKTIQIIAFLAGLCESDVVSKDGKFTGLGPVIIVTPTTIMHQWLREFHLWYPPLRVSILHETGSYSGTKESLIRNLVNSRGVLITSYSGVVIHQYLLLKHEWHYVILDEGHKIRNPDARVTLACKQIRTPHRFILSGSPLQNHLKELWSLFDFIFPGKLGTLPVFMQQFAVPITQGGYSNATQVQVQTAYKCAVVLRDSISPYLLRRMKNDVKMNLNLPGKNEQVLFCRLTEDQRALYKDYLESSEIKSILDGRLQVFVGLINLRKICNHPDLYSGGPKVFGEVDRSQLPEEIHYGFWKRSGKMLVIESVLKLWHRQGHRVLLFSQSKQMLDILERFVKLRDYSYVRMDGGTSIGSRQPLIQKFNNDPSIFVFLLTTRVGGLGVNLTGANRVVIYDPDWNPSTDMQARERAWRIGQQRDVTIYRLLTSGTIEEKIYHRQIFKQFLTNRVLKDPKQRRFFKSNDLLELFVLKDDDVGGSQVTETSVIFAGTGSEVKVSPKSVERDNDGGTHAGSCLSIDKLQKMKELAKKLSQKIGQKNMPTAVNGTKSCDGESKVASDLNKVEVKDSRKHKKHKQNVNKKKIVLDGEVIDNLVRRDTFKSTGGQEEESSKQNSKHDAYVLQKLFAKTGVHTALKHDTIMDSGDPDYMLVEGEAERVAKDAVKALKASRRQCYRAESGVPTWTGQNGRLSVESSRSKPQLRFGQKKNTKLIAEPEKEKVPDSKTNEDQPILFNLLQKKKVFSGEMEMSATSSSPVKPLSSTQLLASMKVRNSLIPTAHDSSSEEEGRGGMEGDDTAASTSSRSTEFRFTTEYDELLVDIRNYIAFQCNVDGRATTAEILNQFRDKVPSQDSAVFKSLLTKICDFSRGIDGEGLWELKGEFR